MNYLSVCSGIEAASVAWEPLGWYPVAFSEIEPFPSAVLAHHWPDVPNLGDMTKFHDWRTIPRPDLIVGGTPCQSFSVAGLRKGLACPRGNLTLTFLAMVDHFKPAWVVWENVPGVLSDRTNAFGQFLAGLGELGYEFAYRVLDAQHFGVPQRRRRVFVVANSTGVHPAQVLFEPESLCGDLAPSREAGEGVAALTANGVGTCGADDNQGQAGHLIPQTANPLTARMHKGVNTTCDEGQTMIPVAFGWQNSASRGLGGDSEAVAPTLDKSKTPAVGFERRIAGSQDQPAHSAYQVRRLTVTECERLQGFPDDHTLIPWRGKDADHCPDGPRYKALGNSMAVPVMAWIGQRIEAAQHKPLAPDAGEA